MSGRIPQEFIDTLLARVDIVDVIDARVPLRKAGQEYTACCPFHQEKTPSFTVSPTKQFYHCFGCGAHGSAIGFLIEHDRLDFPDAVAALAATAGLSVPVGERLSRQEKNQTDVSLYTVLEQVAAFYQKQLQRHPEAVQARAYLKQRGLSTSLWQKFGLGYAPLDWHHLDGLSHDDKTLRTQLVATGMLIQKDQRAPFVRFRGRIMYPIRDRRGRIIAFGGRVLPEQAQTGTSSTGGAKYLNSPETPLFHKGRELYGYYEALQAHRSLSQLILVEGYMDVLALVENDIKNVVATLGTAITPSHLAFLFRRVPHLIFCFDGDRAGRDAAVRALEHCLPMMTEGRLVSFMFLPQGEDPDSYVHKEKAAGFIQACDQAIPLSRFLLEHCIKQVDLTSVDGQARLVDIAKPMVTKLPNGVFKHMVITQLAQAVDMEPNHLMRFLLPRAQQPNKKQRAHSSGRSPAKPRLSLKSFISLSPMQRALSMLLHFPQLARQLSTKEVERLARDSKTQTSVLRELIEFILGAPELTSGQIVEHFRTHQQGELFMQLMTLPCLLPESALLAEFQGALSRIHSLNQQAERDTLLTKAGEHGLKHLSVEEKEQIRQLLSSSDDTET